MVRDSGGSVSSGSSDGSPAELHAATSDRIVAKSHGLGRRRLVGIGPIVGRAPSAGQCGIPCNSTDVASDVQGTLPLVETPLQERGTLRRLRAVEDLHVARVGTQVDPGRLVAERVVAVRGRRGVPQREVAARAVDRLELDLAGPLELGSVRVARALAPPEVEDAGWVE